MSTIKYSLFPLQAPQIISIWFSSWHFFEILEKSHLEQSFRFFQFSKFWKMKFSRSFREKCAHKKSKSFTKQPITSLDGFSNLSHRGEFLMNEFADPNSFSLSSDGSIHIKTESTTSNAIKNDDEMIQIVMDSKANGITWIHLPSPRSRCPSPPLPISMDLTRVKLDDKPRKPEIKRPSPRELVLKPSDEPGYGSDPTKKGLNELSSFLTKKSNSSRQTYSNFAQRFDINDMSYENLLRLDHRPPTYEEISRTGLPLNHVHKIASIVVHRPAASKSSSSSTTSSFTCCSVDSSPLVCSICQDEFKHREAAVCLPKCRHIFHGKCLGPWFVTHSECPNCRQKVI